MVNHIGCQPGLGVSGTWQTSQGKKSSVNDNLKCLTLFFCSNFSSIKLTKFFNVFLSSSNSICLSNVSINWSCLQTGGV